MRITDNYYFFYRHQFGQWTQRDIVDNKGVIYNCCEQYMMYKKGELFEDTETADKILEEKSPKIQQALGRKVKNFNLDVWDQHKQQIVYEGNYLKFTQHKYLKKRLLDTSELILVEASPFDKVWGIGLHFRDDECLNEANWQGQNLLGRALMRVRAALRR